MSNPLADLVNSARRDLELAWASEEQRELELTAAETWARDPLGWIDEHVWTASFLPAGDAVERQRVRPVRMKLFPDQQRTVSEWIDLDQLTATGQIRFHGNILIEKSRQIGETWGFAAIVCWLLHYHRLTGLYMHQREAEVVDREWSAKSFFGRVRFIADHLDPTVPGVGKLTFRPPSSDPAVIVNPRTGALIYGECQRDDPGRGQSLDYAIVDETARIVHGEQVHAALASACPTGKAYLSTPHGSDNVHARLATSQPPGWTYLRLHWSQHPVYSRGAHIAGADPDCQLCEGNRLGLSWQGRDPVAHRYPGRLTSPWYEAEIADKPDEVVAAEYDIDRERSLSGRVFEEFDSAVHVVEHGIKIELDDVGRPLVPFELAVDYGTDTTTVVVLQNTPAEVRVIGLLEMGTQHGTSWVPERVSEELRLLLQELGMPHIETTPDYTRHLRCVGDPAGHAKSQSSDRTLAQQYRRQGFNIQKPPGRLVAKIDFSLMAVKRLLVGQPKPLRICGVNANMFATHLMSNRWQTDALGQVKYGGAMNLNDDVHNHPARAFAYWTVATFPPPDARLNYPPTSDPEEEPARMPLTERRQRAMRRVTAGGDLDDDLPFDDADASL